MGRRVRVVAASSVLLLSGCETWITSSTPPDETLGIFLAEGDRDIVQPLSLSSGPVPASGIDVAFGRDQILIRLDRTIDADTFCVEVGGKICFPALHDPAPNDVEVVNLTRGGERVPLADARLVTPVLALLAADVEEPSPEMDPDLPGGPQPLASTIWLAVDPTYVFQPGDVVRITLTGVVREEAEPHDPMPPMVLVFSVANEDGVAPRVVSDSFTAAERLPPHAVLDLSFSEAIARLSVNVEPPLYGADPGDAARLARDPITGGELVPGSARSVTFLPPAADSVLELDRLYWFQVVSEDCAVDGLGACLLVPTQDESGSELAGGPGELPVSWIRSFRTAPLVITTPTGWPRLAEHQEAGTLAYETLGRQFAVAGRYIANPDRGPFPIHDPIAEIELFLLGSDEFRLGSAVLSAGSFSLAVDLSSTLLGGGLDLDVPDSLATLNGGPVIVEARARTTLGTSFGLDRITIGLDLLPPGPPEITSEASRTFRPSGFGVCSGIPLEGFAQAETTAVELRRPTLVASELLATVTVIDGRFEGIVEVSETTAPSGTHLFARARDAAGNPSDSNFVAVHCKPSGGVEPPILQQPADGFTTADRRIRVQGIVVGANVARVVVSAAGIETVLPVANEAFDGTFLAPVAGTFTFQAFAEDLAGDRSTPVLRTVSVTPDVFLSTSAVSGDAQVAAVGATLAPFIVEARDAGGAPVQGVSVVFALVAEPPAGGGRFNGSPGAITVTTDSVGRAQARLTLSSDPGTSLVEAFASRAASAPVVFHAVGLLPASFTGPSGPPARILPLGGHVQRGTAGSPLGEPFAVLLLDVLDRVVPNTDVFFRVVTPLAGGWQSPSPCTGTGANVACARTGSNGVAMIDAGNPFVLGETIPISTATALLAKEGDAAATLAQIVQVDACLDAGCSAAPSTSLLAISLPGAPASLSDCPGNAFLGPCDPISAVGGAVNVPTEQAPRMLVMDEFQNRIANVSVSFSGATDIAAFFDASTCTIAIPIQRLIRVDNSFSHAFAECGADVVSVPTNTFGLARAGLILGNNDGFTYEWMASAAGLSATSYRISEEFDEERQPFTILIVSASPRNEGGAAMNQQEDPWAVTVVLAFPIDDVEGFPWIAERKEEQVDFRSDNGGTWAQASATANPDGDFFNHFRLGPEPSQKVTILTPNTVNQQTNQPLQFSFDVSSAPVIAELKKEAFSVKQVQRRAPQSPVMDTFAEVWRLRATIRFSNNAIPLLRGRTVPTFNGFVKVIEIPFPEEDKHRNYDGVPASESDFQAATTTLVEVQEGLAKIDAVSLSERRCKVQPCTFDTEFEKPPATSVFARVLVYTPSGLQEVTDPLLDIGSPPDFPMVSMPQWVDHKNLLGKPLIDARPDWLGDSVLRILASASPGREREVLGLVTQDGKASYPQTRADFRVVFGSDKFSGEYVFNEGVINLDILQAPFRLNTSQENIGVTGGMSPDTHNAKHFLRSTLRHEARHAWQDYMRFYPCPACSQDGQPGKPRNDSDSDFMLERAFKPIDGSAVYKDSTWPARGWVSD